MAGSKGTVLTAADHNPAFESVVLAHLDAAYNLARWLTANDHDAQDIVQDACLRAMRAFDTLRGTDARAWLLAIVRNQCMTFLRGRRSPTSFDPDLHDVGDLDADPNLILMRAGDVQLMREAIESLPVDLRTTIVLREIEALSYKHIASVTGVPIGTVMSRLSRGRQRLAQWLSSRDQPEACHDM